MSSILLLFAASTLTAFTGFCAGSDLQVVAEETQATARAENGTAITVETYCSETKLRTTNARVRWTAAASMMEAATAPNAGTSIEVTVYKNGYEKGLWIALPLRREASRERPIAALAQTQAKAMQIRAFQIRVVG